MLAPICLFTYNRIKETKKTVEYLKNNKLANKSILFIFSDGAKDQNEIDTILKVRKYLRTINGFLKIKIIERPSNYGLANNIINGVTKVLKSYEKIIVLEDDLITGKYFLNFMNDALNLYERNEKVISINGYSYFSNGNNEETYFLKTADNLGWGTWKRGWELFNEDGNELLSQIKTQKLDYSFNRNNSYLFTIFFL